MTAESDTLLIDQSGRVQVSQIYSGVLKPGQLLFPREDHAKTAPAYKVLRALKLTSEDRGDPNTQVYVVAHDEKGTSVFINRASTRGGYIEAFLPKSVNWGSYFRATESYAMAYSGAHFTKVFPQDFVVLSEL